MTKKIIAILTLILLVSIACSKNEDEKRKGCGFDNPREELTWLKSRIDSMANSTSTDMQYCYVLQGVYKNRTVFRFEDCNPFVNKFIFTLNCDGNQVGSNDEFISAEDLKNPIIIWKPTDFACQVSY